MDISPNGAERELEREFEERLKSIRMTTKEFDRFCSSRPHILRSIRGHAFEVWFDSLMARSGYTYEVVGGNDIIDRRVNGHSIQLKTPFWNGTIVNKVVQYKMHKTHGRERYPEALYKREEFAEFLVCMHPDKEVIICPTERIPTRAEVNPRLKWGEYIADPVPFDWNTEWLNRYELLGIDYKRLVFKALGESRILPRIAEKIGYHDSEIIKAILDPKNFRVWQQLIVGSVREFHFLKFLTKNGVTVSKPDTLDFRSRVKVDYLYKQQGRGPPLRIQVKGLTKGLCKGPVLGCETQCSHGRIPTRLYRRSDFEILVVVIDPSTISPDDATKVGINADQYNFLFVKMSKLPRHPRSDEWGVEYIKSSYHFNINKVKFNNITELTDYSEDTDNHRYSRQTQLRL